MSQAPRKENNDPTPDADNRPAAGDLDTLRHILVGPEDVRLDRLERRLDDDGKRAHEISRVLPDAIVLSNAASSLEMS